MIINLPYNKYEDQYLKNYKIISKSKHLTREDQDYLEDRHDNRFSWVKCYVKKLFTCGMVSSSRIESKHRVYKRFLDSNTRLSELFSIFKELEEEEINNFKDEFEKSRNLSKENDEAMNKNPLIQKCSNLYSNYIVSKVKMNVILVHNYKALKKQNYW